MTAFQTTRRTNAHQSLKFKKRNSYLLMWAVTKRLGCIQHCVRHNRGRQGQTTSVLRSLSKTRQAPGNQTQYLQDTNSTKEPRNQMNQYKNLLLTFRSQQRIANRKELESMASATREENPVHVVLKQKIPRISSNRVSKNPRVTECKTTGTPIPAEC